MPTEAPITTPAPITAPAPTHRPTPAPSERPTRRPRPWRTRRPRRAPTERPTPYPTYPSPHDGPNFCQNVQSLKSSVIGADLLPPPVEVELSAHAVLQGAKVPRGMHPKPTYEDVYVCPSPTNFPQIGPASANESSATVGNLVAWGSVPFRWRGVYYTDQSFLCVSSLNSDKFELPCARRRQCQEVESVPLGLIAAGNMIVMVC